TGATGDECDHEGFLPERAGAGERREDGDTFFFGGGCAPACTVSGCFLAGAGGRGFRDFAAEDGGTLRGAGLSNRALIPTKVRSGSKRRMLAARPFIQGARPPVARI